MSNKKIVIDLESFKGKTPQDLKAHIEQFLSNIKCVVKVPNRERSPVFIVNFMGNKKLTINTDDDIMYRKWQLKAKATPKQLSIHLLSCE